MKTLLTVFATVGTIYFVALTVGLLSTQTYTNTEWLAVRNIGVLTVAAWLTRASFIRRSR